MARAGGATISVRVQARNEFGRFIKLTDEAAEKTARDLTDKATELAKGHAPVETGRLRDSIEAEYHGKVGYVKVGAAYGHSIEAGAVAHAIPRRGATIMHPGNRAQPFLAPAGRELQAFAPGILARNYPG